MIRWHNFHSALWYQGHTSNIIPLLPAEWWNEYRSFLINFELHSSTTIAQTFKTPSPKEEEEEEEEEEKLVVQ